MPYEAQLLFRHNVADEPDGIQIQKHFQSLRNMVGRESRAAADVAAPNEKVTEFEALGAVALAEMGGGEQPLAWKRTEPRL
jgi:hypothetical protein